MDIDKLREEARGQVPCMRSCWNCNPGHEALKESDQLICCLLCGHWYYKGQDITEEK